MIVVTFAYRKTLFCSRHLGKSTFKTDPSLVILNYFSYSEILDVCFRHLDSETAALNNRANRIIVTEFGTVGVPDPCLSLYSRFTAWFAPALNGYSTDNCSVNVLQLKDQMLAMTEANTVRIINPETLETLPEKVLHKFIFFCS